MTFREFLVLCVISAGIVLLLGYTGTQMLIDTLEHAAIEEREEIERRAAPLRALSEKQALKLYLLEEENELLREIFSRTGGGRDVEEIYKKARRLGPTEEQLSFCQSVLSDQLGELNDIYLERAELRLELERARARISRLDGKE